MTSGLANILQECSDNLLVAEKQLHDKEVASSDSFESLEEFWKEIDSLSKCLSHECTKVCISFSSPPLPSSTETSSLLHGIEKAVLGLVSCVYRLEIKWGLCLHSEILEAAVSAIQATRQLLRVIKDDEGIGDDSRYRRATGVAWEGCKAIELCPKNNCEAVIKLLRSQNSLICDAFQEITEALKGDGSGWNLIDTGSDDSDDEDEPKWSDQDKELIGHPVNLLKAAKLLFKNIISSIDANADCTKLENNKELDQIYGDCKPISENIDNLVLEVYPPLDVDSMQSQSQSLAELIITGLKTAVRSHYITETEKDGIEFVQRAVDHNLKNMKNALRTLNTG